MNGKDAHTKENFWNDRCVISLIALVVSLITKETQVRTTMRYNYTLTRMSINDGPSCIHKLKAAVVAGTRPVQQTKQHSSVGGGEGGEVSSVSSCNWAAMSRWWLLREEESVFFKGVAPGGPHPPQVGPDTWVYQQHKIDLMNYWQNKKNKSIGNPEGWRRGGFGRSQGGKWDINMTTIYCMKSQRINKNA